VSTRLDRNDPASRAAAALYGLAVRAHDRIWSSGVRRPWTAPVPVLSVGNLTVGGTGKTPTVIRLAADLAARGWRPAVLSRGHGRKSGEILVLRPGAPPPPAAIAGDEPVEIFEALGNVPVGVGADRRAVAGRVLENSGVNLLILDDGFQHRPMARTIDLVLLDAARPFGNGRLLPAGTLREPREALARADMVLLTRADRATDLEAVRREVAGCAPGAWIGTAVHQVSGFTALAGGARPSEAVAVCAIARPETFLESLRKVGVTGAPVIAFPDHHRFDASDYRRVVTAAVGRAVVTTAKDAVRWRGVPGFDPAGWWVLDIRLEPCDRFLSEVERRLAAATR
jgi:tetraacyldisaccharide 4'-kinase